jgi:hypothetical protein
MTWSRLRELITGKSHLEVELERVSKAYRSSCDFVVVHTCGKVGSTALHAAISAVPGAVSFQTHFISPQGIAAARLDHNDLGHDPLHLHIGEQIQRELANDPQRPVMVVCAVRDPIARAISNLFENPQLTTGERDLKAISMQQLTGHAIEQVNASLAYMERWFDTEIAYLTGENPFAHPFDKLRGYLLHEHSNPKLLICRLEDLSERGGPALASFLGRENPIPIVTRRRRQDTSQGSLYETLQANLVLPRELIEMVYASRMCKHFYSDAELAGFVSRWSAHPDNSL